MTHIAEASIVLLPPQRVYVTLSAAVTHSCPVDGTADCDHVVIVYDARQGVIEAHSLEVYLAGFDPMAVTIENLVSMIEADLQSVGIVAQVWAYGEHGDALTVDVTTWQPT